MYSCYEEKDEDTTLIKLPEVQEDDEQRVESYIHTLPMKTTVSNKQSPAAVVSASTSVNIVLVGLSGVDPATGTPNKVVPLVLMPPTSTAVLW